MVSNGSGKKKDGRQLLLLGKDARRYPTTPAKGTEENVKFNSSLKIPQLVEDNPKYAIVYVPSHRREGVWHRITIDKIKKSWSCDCDGFRYYHKCVDINILRWYGIIKRKHRKKGVQDTSKIAFKMLTTADLSDRRKKVFWALKSLGLATDKEIGYHLHWPINTVTPRRGELFELGFIRVANYKDDEATGRPVTVWKAIDGIVDDRIE